MEIFLFTIVPILGIIYLAVRNKYAIGIVRGNSMLPTYKPFEPVIVKRKYVLKSGNVYAVKVENNLVIKRVTGIIPSLNGKSSKIFIQGDNLDDSRDSRDYGYLPSSTIIGEVVKIKELFGGRKNG